jgi:hypothetical protein
VGTKDIYILRKVLCLFCFSCWDLPNHDVAYYVLGTIGKPSLSRILTKVIWKFLDLRCEIYWVLSNFCHWKIQLNYQKMILKGKISWVNNSHLGNGTYYTCCCDVRVSPRTPLIWASTSNFHINTLCWMNKMPSSSRPIKSNHFILSAFHNDYIFRCIFRGPNSVWWYFKAICHLRGLYTTASAEWASKFFFKMGPKKTMFWVFSIAKIWENI